MIDTLAYWYSSDSAWQELPDEYQHCRVKDSFETFLPIGPWTKRSLSNRARGVKGILYPYRTQVHHVPGARVLSQSFNCAPKESYFMTI